MICTIWSVAGTDRVRHPRIKHNFGHGDQWRGTIVNVQRNFNRAIRKGGHANIFPVRR
jgi:hypothetical protein